MRLFAWPRVGRAGLGNSLLPWARAELFAAQSGARLLEPDWTSLRVGPYLRGEADKRSYGGYFHARNHVRGLAKWLVRTTARRVREDDTAGAVAPRSRAVLVVFSGLRDFFAPLLPHSSLIRRRLWQMTLAELRPADAARGGDFIAMHVRRGDLTRQGFSPDEIDAVRQYTPLSWFVEMARAIRGRAGIESLPIVVFTDGYADEVSELLKLPGVELNPRAPAITDLWAMSRACLLLGSGYSTFSMWASYLGGMPTLYAPGKLAQRVLAGRKDALELEVPAQAGVPAQVVETICSALSRHR
jgi:hypothetical protein